MKQEITLLIMAAGMGTRYGGLKQIEPVGDQGEFLIDYSIYDAIKVGFTKVVFVIKRENEQIFKETIGNRVTNLITVEYAFQDIGDLPEGCTVPEGREKPWGTAHAVYAARHVIDGPSAVINADDFYGRDAYEAVYHFLVEKHQENTYCLVGYRVQNTLSENGTVKRAICYTKGQRLESLTESSIEKLKGEIIVSPLDGSGSFVTPEDTLVSMNMLGFYSNLFTYIEKKFPLFLEKHKNNKMNSEFFIPDILCEANQDDYGIVKVVPTEAVWQGITYKEDKDVVKKALAILTVEGKYSNPLWK